MQTAQAVAAPQPARPEPFRFPNRITTKRHALEVADQIFPPQPEDYKRWLVQTIPLDQYQRLHELEDRLRDMLEWLYDDDGHMRVYQRPRTRHFWWRIIKNLRWNIEDALTLIDQCLTRERAIKKGKRIIASYTIEGDGQGI